jgi:hypothetical protein
MNKAKLPTKTRIAVWWIYLFGTTALIFTLLPVFLGMLVSPAFCLETIAVAILYFVPAILLFTKNTTAWESAVIILSIEPILIIIFGVIYCVSKGYAIDGTIISILLLTSIIVFLPLILIILDRKNYFEMVRQRESEKKGNG